MSLVCTALTWPMWWRAQLDRLRTPAAPALQRFQHALADELGCPADELLLYGAGRMGLYAWLEQLALQPGDEVILPAYTCVVVPNAAHFAGATVRYVDIDPHTLTYDLPRLLEAVNARTRVLVLPANYGLPLLGLDTLRARFPQLLLVADLAHALGSMPEPVLATRSLDAAFFSFEFSKCLTTGMGGALWVRDPELRKTLASQRLQLPVFSLRQRLQLGMTVFSHLLAASGAVTLGRWTQGVLRRLGLLYATSEELSGLRPAHYPLQLHTGAAHLGWQQLRAYAGTKQLRREQAIAYQQALAGLAGVRCLPLPDGAALLRFPLLLEGALAARRKAIMQTLQEATGLPVGMWFNHVVHPVGSSGHGYVDGQCPQGEQVAAAMLNLPLGRHVRLSAARLARLRQCLQEALA